MGMIFDKKMFGDFDKALFFAMIFIAVMGLISIHSATHARNLPFKESFLLRQAEWMLVSLLFLTVIIKVAYYRLVDMAYLLYAFIIIMLALVLAVGHVRLGAQRWISIAGFAFQPSEFIKVVLIMALANYLGSKKDTMWRLENLIIPIILLALPFVLVLLQPDLGTALLLVPIFFAMLLVGGANIKHLAVMVGIGLAGMPFFWHFLRDYQKQRLMVFINPNVDPLGAGYTIIQSKISVGSGGLFGKGWMSGTQNQLNFLPERHTDFIFSVIGEEWGFLGALVILVLYALIIKETFDIASSTSDRTGKLLATGVGMLLAFQVIINISMTIGVMPVVGIPLPLVSYGGSSLFATMMAIGLVLNVGMRRSAF
jgi:rod shape determining protein RodA